MASDTPDGPPAGAAAARPRRHPLRSALAVVLILAAALLTAPAVVAAWAASEIDDTDRYLATVAPLARNPAVQAAVTDRVTTAVVDRLPADLLPGATGDNPLGDLLQQFAPALGAGLAGLVHGLVRDIVTSDAFPAIWTAVNRDAHAALDDALAGRDGAVTITDDTVTLDLAPVVEQVRAGLVADGVAAAAAIPDVDATYTLVRSDRVGATRDVLRRLAEYGFRVPVCAVACALAGVLCAVRRRRALTAAALAMAAAAAALGTALVLLRGRYLDRLPADVDRAAAAAVYDALVRHLHGAVRTVVVLGVIVALGAWLGGPGRAPRQVRGRCRAGLGRVRTAVGATGARPGPVGRFVHRRKPWLSAAAVAAAAVVLVLRPYPTALVVLGLAAALLVVLAVLELLDTGGPGAAGPTAGKEAR
ncbi:hypothetical protein KNE206_72700 [Kitasatospora sp. NE20-6]|uniref:hypothetical protein n=1 Tax=Kitasatospora sp. NE20-6 TaxID=2859066 RepID=UPI0034DCAC72